MKEVYGSQFTVWDNYATAAGFQTGAAEVLSVSFARVDAAPATVLEGGEKVRLRICARANQALERPILGFMVRDRLGQDLFGENTLPFTEGQQLRALAGEQVYGDFVFRLPMLPNGQYTVTVSIADGTLHDHVQHHYLHDALVLTVASARVRWGLVGVQFDSVGLSVGSG
jgi:lipopolysaccharide transport system ATP-binding protein